MAEDENWDDDAGNDFGDTGGGGGGDDDGFGDDAFEDENFEDNGDDGWGDADDLTVNDGFNINPTTKSKPKHNDDDDDGDDGNNDDDDGNDDKDKGPTPWKCLECQNQNPGGLLCLKCNKPNLGELDRQKRIQTEKDCKYWARHYADVYLPLRLFVNSKGEIILDKEVIVKIIRDIYAHEGFDRKFPDLKKWKPQDLKANCESCTLPFSTEEEKGDEHGKCVREELTCHANICRACFQQWIRSKIKDEDIVPHIRCPASDCDCSIPYGNFVNHYNLSVQDLYEFASVYCEKMLSRNSNWFPCLTPKCKYGFVFKTTENEKTAVCDACDNKHNIKRKEERDEGFNEMLKEGKIRLCPVCKFPHMKDYGLCNVLQCGKCNMWWNWRTLEYAKTSKELKDKARMTHTLWEPGELEYQQKLQQENPEAFKELLERNGIKYDPNFRRGVD